MAQMSSDLVNDLTEAFEFYDTDNDGLITLAQFRNIMQNFGYHAMAPREANDELKSLDGKFFDQNNPRNCVNLAFVKEVIAYRQYNIKGTKECGRDEEARDCFRLFDKYEKNMINAQNIKTQLNQHLDFPVGDPEIQEFMEFVGHENGWVYYKDFVKFYQS